MKQVGITHELPGTNGGFTTAVFQDVPAQTPLFVLDSEEEKRIHEDAELLAVFAHAVFQDTAGFLSLMGKIGSKPKDLDGIRQGLRIYRDAQNANKQNQQAV